MFQLGWWLRVLTSINQWNVFETPFPVPLQVFVQLIFVVALLAFLIRRFASSRAQEERYSADLEAARSLQQVLIPETLPIIPGLDISVAYHPAQEVGGDFTRYFRYPSPHRTPRVTPSSSLATLLGKASGSNDGFHAGRCS